MSRIHPTAIIEAGAELAADVEVGPYCLVGPEVQLDDGVRLISHVSVEGRTRIGARTEVGRFAVLGAPPQHTGYRGEPTALTIGPDNTIREHVTMHRGTVGGGGETRVGARGFYMANAHVAHDCRVGDDVIVAHGGTLGGHSVLEDGVFIGGLSATHQRTHVGRGAFLGAVSMLNRDLVPFGSAMGSPASLIGLNWVGLKRRGFDRTTLQALRNAYRQLFHGEGALSERVAAAAARFADVPEVMEMVDFMRDGSGHGGAGRSVCLPQA